MRILALSILILLAGFISLAPRVCALLYDFEDAGQMDDWEVTDGQGEMEGSAFVLQADGGEGKAFVGSTDWTDYTITCKATMVGGNNNYGVIYRYQDNVNYYMNSIKFVDQQATWAARISGNYLQGQAGMRLPFASEMNKQYELKIEVEGNQFKFYVDGEMVQEFSNDEFDKGAVGLRVYSSHAVFDDFEVNGPGIPKSGGAPVEPKWKLAIAWGNLKSRN